MDGFSSFFAVSETEFNEWAGMILRLAITGYNKWPVDNLMTQKVIVYTVQSVVGDVWIQYCCGDFHLLYFGQAFPMS
jgi:hypothetical protein